MTFWLVASAATKNGGKIFSKESQGIYPVENEPPSSWQIDATAVRV